jgi:uncharacterized protein (DUF427 family)
MKRAMWNGAVIAESEAIQIVDGYPYFPPDAVKWERLREIAKTSVCGWKGTANYYDVVVGEQVNGGAAWVYRDAKPAAKHIEGHIGFWRGVKVE